MLNNIIKAVIISTILPFYLLGGDLSIQVGVNHSWLYYPDGLINAENEFNPNLSIGLNATIFSKGNFGSSFGLRFFSAGRFDKYKIGSLHGELEIKHLYLSMPLQLDYTIISNLKTYINLEPALQINTKFKNTVTNEKKTITDEMNRYNLFLGIGLNYRFNMGKHELGVGGLVNYGLFRISKHEKFDVTEEGSRFWVDWRAREVLLNIEYFIGS